MSSKNQRLNATITIGSALDGSVKKNIGVLKSGLHQVGDAIKTVEKRQKELDRQRDVLRKQGESVEHLDREYEDLERTLNDLRRAQERWNRAAAASKRVGSTFRDAATDIGRNARRIAIGAAAASGAIFGLAASTAQLGDDVAKTAGKLGIGIEQLQELRYAAERSGVSTSAFDSSLEKMPKNLGEAASGTGTAKDALDQLGLSAKDLIAVSPEEALGMIADRMQGVESAAEKAALANDIFGRSGIGMINMLRDGSKGLTQLREDARRTGYVMSEQAARDAEVFQDTLLDTQLIMKGLKNTVGAELMPVVTQSMRRVGDALVTNRADVQRWSKDFAGGVERAIPIVGELATGVGRIGSAVWRTVEATAVAVGGWENLGVIIGAVLAGRTIAKVAKFGAAVFSLGRAMFSLARATPLAAGGIRAIGAALVANPIGIAVTAIAGGAYLIYRNWGQVAPWFKERWENVKSYFGGFADFVGGAFTGDMSRAKDGLEAMWSGASAFWSGVWGGIGRVFVAAWENVIKPVTDALGLTDPIERAWSWLSGALGTIVSGIGTLFNTVWTSNIKPMITGLGSLDGIGEAWQGVKSAIGGVLDWLAEKFKWVWGVIQPVIDGLWWVKEKGGAVLSGIGLGGGSDDQGKSKSSPGPHDPNGPRPIAKAIGGSFSPGPLMVGELGPELRYENSAGFIAHNRALRQMAGMSDRVGSVMDKASRFRSHAPQQFARAASALSKSSGSDRDMQAGLSAASARVDALFARTPMPSGKAEAAARQITQNITYTINAAGASADEIMRLVERKSRQAAGNGLFDRAPSIGPFGR